MADKTAEQTESAIDQLYRGPLDAFTNERNALSASLRKAGRREDADRVKALGKPSVTAWAVNQVWWTDRRLFDAMLTASARLRKAHLTWSGGGQADVRAAAEDRRVAVRAVVEAALAALGDPKTAAPDQQYRIAGTVEALASGAVPDAVPGRLTKDLQASGLEGLGALAEAAAAAPPATKRPARPTLVHSKPAAAAAPEAPPRKADSAKDAAAKQREQERGKIEARLKELESRLEAMTREAEEREEEASRAKEEADAAHKQVSDLEEQLEQAREREKEARRAVVEASKAASETEMVRARTARDVAAAREQRQRLQPT